MNNLNKTPLTFKHFWLPNAPEQHFEHWQQQHWKSRLTGTYAFVAPTHVRLEAFTPIALFECLKLRSAIFVVEQNCIYPDIESTDLQSIHICIYTDILIGTCRVYLNESAMAPDKLVIKIGRVAVDANYRHRGMGRALMVQALAVSKQLTSPALPIEISAQEYLLDFYSSLGFHPHGASYLEDGIPHRLMLLG